MFLRNTWVIWLVDWRSTTHQGDFLLSKWWQSPPVVSNSLPPFVPGIMSSSDFCQVGLFRARSTGAAWRVMFKLHTWYNLNITNFPPPRPNSSNFMQVLGKFGKIICWYPTKGRRPHLGEILDPTLIYVEIWVLFYCPIDKKSTKLVLLGWLFYKYWSPKWIAAAEIISSATLTQVAINCMEYVSFHSKLVN